MFMLIGEHHQTFKELVIPLLFKLLKSTAEGGQVIFTKEVFDTNT